MHVFLGVFGGGVEADEKVLAKGVSKRLPCIRLILLSAVCPLVQISEAGEQRVLELLC